MPLIKTFVRLSSDVFQTFSFIFQKFVGQFPDDLSPLPDVAEMTSPSFNKETEMSKSTHCKIANKIMHLKGSLGAVY